MTRPKPKLVRLVAESVLESEFLCFFQAPLLWLSCSPHTPGCLATLSPSIQIVLPLIATEYNPSGSLDPSHRPLFPLKPSWIPFPIRIEAPFSSALEWLIFMTISLNLNLQHHPTTRLATATCPKYLIQSLCPSPGSQAVPWVYCIGPGPKCRLSAK